MHDLEFGLSRSLKVIVNGRKPTYDFLLMNNSKYAPICSIFRYIAIQCMCHLQFDLLIPLKDKVIGTIRKPTYSIL